MDTVRLQFGKVPKAFRAQRCKKCCSDVNLREGEANKNAILNLSLLTVISLGCHLANQFPAVVLVRLLVRCPCPVESKCFPLDNVVFQSFSCSN